MNHGFQSLLQKFQPSVTHFTGMEKTTCSVYLSFLFTFHCDGVYLSLIEGSLSPKYTLQKHPKRT